MMKITFTVLASLLVVSTAWQLKPDDTEKLKKKKEEIASKNLEGWKQACAKQDKELLKDLTDDMIETLKKAQKNNDKVLPGIRKAMAAIKSNAADGESSFWDRKKLEGMVNVIDGNRDNVSYYTFDAAIEWIKRRLNCNVGKLISKMAEAQAVATKAQSLLDKKAQMFVKLIKKIKEDLEKKDRVSAFEDIRREIVPVDEEFSRRDLEDLTQRAIDLAEETKWSVFE